MNNAPIPLSKLKARYARFVRAAAPLLPLLVVTWVSCYLLPVSGKHVGIPRAGGEFFPFSSFPMYSANDEETYMVYLTNDAGEALGVQAVFGVRTSALKKDYDRELRKIAKSLQKRTVDLTPKEKEPAGRSALEYLVLDRAKDQAVDSGLKAVRLVDMRIFWSGGELKREKAEVARVELNPGSGR